MKTKIEWHPTVWTLIGPKLSWWQWRACVGRSAVSKPASVAEIRSAYVEDTAETGLIYGITQTT